MNRAGAAAGDPSWRFPRLPNSSVAASAARSATVTRLPSRQEARAPRRKGPLSAPHNPRATARAAPRAPQAETKVPPGDPTPEAGSRVSEGARWRNRPRSADSHLPQPDALRIPWTTDPSLRGRGCWELQSKAYGRRQPGGEQRPGAPPAGATTLGACCARRPRQRPGLQPPGCSAAQGASNMAAAGGSSSSSEEEEEGALALARLREAAWDPALLRNPTGGIFKKSKLTSAESSIRERASDHGQDGNELQTTPEFRAHVAKKLGAILDSSIKPVEPPLWPMQKDTAGSRTEDDGFRLFSSSVPGDCGKPEPLPSGRRGWQCSSSSELDSDQEWQRCQEAAVTAADILKQGGLLAVLQDSGRDQSCQAPEPSMKKKKKRKKREKSKLKGKSDGEQEGIDSAEKDRAGAETEGSPCLNGARKRAEDAVTEGRRMAKKKKRKKVQARAE